MREVFFEGFRKLRARLGAAEGTGEPRADLMQLIEAYRDFIRDNPMLAEVMFSRPFADLTPSPPIWRRAARCGC